jgi:hypothetical protein
MQPEHWREMNDLNEIILLRGDHERRKSANLAARAMRGSASACTDGDDERLSARSARPTAEGLAAAGDSALSRLRAARSRSSPHGAVFRFACCD